MHRSDYSQEYGESGYPHYGGGTHPGDDGDYYGPPTPLPPTPVVIPEEVGNYLRHFKRCVINRSVTEIYRLYEYDFNELTERFYKEKFWPTAEQITQIVGDDCEFFLLLYKEMYYRYVYARITRGPSLDYRYHSYNNYSDLFCYILNAEEPVPFHLPDRWIWDIVDEFVYQFQSFCQYKANPSKRSPDDLQELIRMERDVWNLYPVLNILYSVVSKSQINEQLKALVEGGNPDEVADEFGSHPLYFKLGYFALIGLLRLHILIGDYTEALATVKYLEFDPKGLYNTVPSCFVTLHYYVGFAQMMMRNYSEAIKIFVNALLFIQRTRNLQQQQHKTWQYDVIGKTNDQIFQLLAICMTLQPQRIDESVHSQLTEKLSDRINRMAKGGPEALVEFENAFVSGCPKFLAPTVTVHEQQNNYAKEPTNQQVRMFMIEMKEQELIPVLRGYLKLYSSIPVSKLASFMELQQEELVAALLSYKHKLCDVSSVADEEDTTADLDFYIDKDMIHVADTKVGRRYGEYFIRHIQKLMELNKNLEKISLKVGAGSKGK